MTWRKCKNHGGYGFKTDCSVCNGKSPARLKEGMIEAIHHAERCAYSYASPCEIGDERTEAFGIYEEIRTVTRVR